VKEKARNTQTSRPARRPAEDTRFRELFTECPVSLWEEDFTGVLERFDQLRASGVEDLAAHLEANPAEVVRCVGLVEVVAVNRATLELFEAADEEQLRAGLASIFTPESLPTFRSILVALARGERDFSGEAVNRTLGGRVLHVHLRWSRLTDPQGRTARAIVSCVDLTGSREAEGRLRAIFDQLGDGVLVADIESRGFVEANAAVCTMLGYTREELLGMGVEHIHPREELARVAETFARQGRGEVSIAADIPMLRRDGTVFYADINAARMTMGGRACLLGIFRDATERRRTEAALRESTRVLETVIDTAPTCVKLLGEAGELLRMNRAGLDMIEAEELEQVRGRCVYGLVDPEHREAFRGLVEDVFAGRGARLEFRMTGLRGRSLWLHSHAVPLRDEEGRVSSLLSVTADVTERRAAEERLREREAFIRSVLDAVDEGFIVVDRDYRILTTNRAYGAQLGVLGEEALGRRCHEVTHRSAEPCFERGEDCAVRRVFETGRSATAVHRHLDGAGGLRIVETKAFPLVDAEGRLVAAIETVSDITEKHQLVEEQLKTQKLESIGTLAGGIAHDFNNLLQGVFGYISMAKLGAESPERTRALLEEAEKALGMSVNLTSQLLTFAKGGEPVKRRFAPGPVVETAARFALSGSRAEARIEIEPGLWHVEADAGQIGQVVQNIVLNAAQAMPLGGLVTVTARNLPAAEAATRPGLAPGDHVEIAVLDEGVGISSANIDRVFDPYFTTKERGSGLGLATSYSIVRGHGGHIEVRSSPGAGSRFAICLPASAGRAAEPEATRGAAAAGPARILLMDDEEVVRKVGGELLRALGHEPVLVRDGEAALALYRAARDRGRPFDLVVLDLTIRGGLGGAETIRRLRELDPGVVAVVTSGYSDDAVTASFREHGFRAFLRKPFNLEELQAVLADLLPAGTPGDTERSTA